MSHSRHGQLEDRDPYRLKDRNGVPVICFRCGTSALPSGLAASAPSNNRPRRSASVTHSATPESGKSMVSCDYCNLHWHLDCVDPPLTSMPSFGKKWMCPNHADQVLVSSHKFFPSSLWASLTGTFLFCDTVAAQATHPETGCRPHRHHEAQTV